LGKRKLQIPNNAIPKQRVNPMDRPEYSEADIQALRAVARGTATADQQIRMFDYMVNHICDTYGQHWRVDPHMTNLCLGQALPGQHMIFMLKHAPVTTDTAATSIRAMEKRNETP